MFELLVSLLFYQTQTQNSKKIKKEKANTKISLRKWLVKSRKGVQTNKAGGGDAPIFPLRQ